MAVGSLDNYLFVSTFFIAFQKMCLSYEALRTILEEDVKNKILSEPKASFIDSHKVRRTLFLFSQSD